MGKDEITSSLTQKRFLEERLQEDVLAMLQIEQYSEAKEQINGFISRYGLSSHVCHLQGVCFHHQSQFSDALIHYYASWEMDPQNIEPLLNYVITLCDLGCYNNAEQSYKKILDFLKRKSRTKDQPLTANLVAYHKKLGDEYLCLNRLKEAINEYQKAILISDQNFVKFSLVKALVKDKNYPKAMKYIDDLLLKYPFEYEYHVWKGIILLQTESKESARKSWKMASQCLSNDVKDSPYQNL